MSTDLDPFGGPVTVGSVTLKTPGLAGTAEAHPPGSMSMRGAELSTDAFEEALRNERMESQETIEIVDTQEVDVGGSVPTRSNEYAEPVIELEVPDPGGAFGQVVLYVDESGVTTWNLARDEGGAVETTRGAATRTYLLRRSIPTIDADAAESRGLVGAVSKKLLKVLVFPLIDPVIGKVGDYFANRWEREKRPYRVRTFTPADYNSAGGRDVDHDAWTDLSAGRNALLFVHGTLSRTHAGFGRLPWEYVEELHRLYDGRVFAFDHFTLSETPKQNVEWLVQQIPEGAKLTLDIVCHSRGGLVSRVLAEKQSELSLGSRTIRVRKIVFVATPNGGTMLTDAKYLGDLIDTYTNLLNFFPDTGVVEVLEGVITVTKQLALGALKGLDGLQSMTPTGTFLKGLNAGARDDKQYFALASNYEPGKLGLSSFADTVSDRIFAKADNDLVVPTRGVYDGNGSGFFPIDDRHLFPAADAVPHTRFFGNPVTQEKIAHWLAH